jgi:hypothetical protein
MVHFGFCWAASPAARNATMTADVTILARMLEYIFDLAIFDL